MSLSRGTLDVIAMWAKRPKCKTERQEHETQYLETIGNLREILILAYFHKLSYAEIAGMLRIPVGTVKSRLHTAVGRFAEDWNASMLCEAAN